MHKRQRLVMLAAAVGIVAIPLVEAVPASAGISLDLGITKTHTGNFTVGTPGVFTITVDNSGPSPSGSDVITVSDTLPAGLTYVSDTGAGVGMTCGVAAQTVTCSGTPGIASGSNISFTITVAVDGAAVPSVQNTATVSESFNSDNNPDNDSSTDTVTVSPAATTTSTTTTTTTTVPATTTTVATKATGLARTGSSTAPIVALGLGLVLLGLVMLRLRQARRDSRGLL